MRPEILYPRLQKYAVIPVVAVESIADALPLADALIEGGLPVAEITFRTAVAADVIAKLKKERPQLLLGAGTLVTLENLRKARACGAQFGVAPGLSPQIVREAGKLEMPFIPGVMTPSDIEAALSSGISVLKFFPAEASGGVNMIKALTAPYAHMGIKLMPTGGINLTNLQAYLSLAGVLMVGGTWIAKKEDIAAHRWDVIKANCHEVVKRIAQIGANQD